MGLIENDPSMEAGASLELLNQLQEELHRLEELRASCRELGRSLVQEGINDIERDLNDYLRVEDETMMKLAQMRISIAQQAKATSSPAAAGTFILFSYSILNDF